MASPFYELTIDCEGQSALTQKQIWEREFSENQFSFADMLAKALASKIIRELSEIVANPYYNEPSQDEKIFSNLSLYICSRESSKKILKLLMNEEIPSPFKDWLEVFSKKKESFNIIGQKVKEELIPKSLSFLEPKINDRFFRQYMSLLQQPLTDRLMENLGSHYLR